MDACCNQRAHLKHMPSQEAPDQNKWDKIPTREDDMGNHSQSTQRQHAQLGCSKSHLQQEEPKEVVISAGYGVTYRQEQAESHHQEKHEKECTSEALCHHLDKC